MSVENAESQLVLKSKASDLLNYCLKHNDWDLSYDSPVVMGFIKAALYESSLMEKWSTEVAYDCLFDLLEKYCIEIGSIDPPTSEPDVNKFVGEFVEIMELNIADHWLVIPLHKAKLDNVIHFDNYLFLPGDMPREEKINILADQFSMSREEMTWRAEHTEKTRSPSFYEYTLLCHRITHHTPWVDQMALSILLFDIALLRVINNALGLDTRRIINIESIQKSKRVKNRHVLINAKSPSRWSHRPIWADDNSTDLPGGLDWLQNPNHQSKFIELVTLMGYEKGIDRLAFRFRKAVLLFNKAINLQLNARQSSEGFALEILHLMIAAESLLLDRESEKRLRLAVLLSRLVRVEGKTIHEIYSTIDKIYNWRSDYVHSGNDVFPEYDENFQEGDIQQKVYLVRHTISQLIVSAPRWIRISESRIQGEPSDRGREKAWFGYLNEIWQSVLAGANYSSS